MAPRKSKKRAATARRTPRRTGKHPDSCYAQSITANLRMTAPGTNENVAVDAPPEPAPNLAPGEHAALLQPAMRGTTTAAVPAQPERDGAQPAAAPADAPAASAGGPGALADTEPDPAPREDSGAVRRPRGRARSVDAARRVTAPPSLLRGSRRMDSAGGDDSQLPPHPAFFLRSPPGPCRPGIPRADTPWAEKELTGQAQLSTIPPGHASMPDPPRGEPGTAPPPSVGGGKRDTAMRSPQAKHKGGPTKRARTAGVAGVRPPVLPTAPNDDVFTSPAPGDPVAAAPAAIQDPPATRPGSPVINPADVPLPSPNNTFDESDIEDLYAATDPGDDGPASSRGVTNPTEQPGGLWLASSGGTAAHGRDDGDGTRALPLIPGSLAAQMAATNDILPTSKDAFIYTPMPAGGPPAVNAASPRWLFQNLDVPQIVLWESIAGGKCFCTIFGAGGADHLLDKTLFTTVAAIRSELVRFTNIATLKVTPPDPAVRPTTTNAPPYGFLVHGIPDAAAERLIAMGFLSTPKVTVLFFPFAVTFPTIMISFMFISDKTTEEVRRMVVALLRRQEHRDHLLDLVSRNPAASSSQAAHHLLRDIIKSARVDTTPRTGKGGTPTPVFNLYIDTQASAIDEWKHWKSFFTTLHWHDASFGTLGLHDDVQCPGCRGADHYWWACPYMAIPHWKGTMPKGPGRAGPTAETRNAPTKPATSTKRRSQHTQ